MKYKFVSLLTASILLMFCMLGCNNNSNEDSNFKTNPAVSKPTIAPDASLSLEAGLVMKSGDVKPVARSTFYLLNKDLTTIGREIGWTGSGNNKLFIDRNLVADFAFGLLAGGEMYIFNSKMEQLKRRSVATLTTDFSGKGQFTSLKPGTYYLVNISKFGSNIVFWNLKVELKSGQNSIILDKNNSVNIDE